MRRAKIVATLGPATESYEMIRAIIDAGVDVTRLNLSHGSYAEHEVRFANVRKAAEDAGRAVALGHAFGCAVAMRAREVCHFAIGLIASRALWACAGGVFGMNQAASAGTRRHAAAHCAAATAVAPSAAR